jgi:hypothetical protein
MCGPADVPADWNFRTMCGPADVPADWNFRTMCGPADVPAAFIVDPGKAKHARLFEPAAVSLVSVS